jgi:pimeloyl-ACP methyl ester carboxylesterase
MRRYLQTGIIICLLSFSALLFASDLAKEKRWEEQIVDAIFDGEAVTLKSGDVEFLAIYTQSASNAGADAVILLHGLGVHPDWDQVIRPLRTGLPENGWSTLSLQMPVLANGIGYEEYAPLFKDVPGRINAGIDYLKANGAKRIAIVAHSLGAAMGSYYLASNTNESIKGFIGIGMSGSRSHADMDNIRSLERITLPVFDLYGEQDLDNVVASAKTRYAAISKAGNSLSQQKQVAGADHFFNGHNDALSSEVIAWLGKL